MQLRIVKNGLEKILNVCKRNGFFNIQTAETSLISFQCGALGSLLRRNIIREWLSSVINNSDVYMFPLEVQVLEKQSKPLKIFSSQTDSLFLDVFKNYFKLLPTIGTELSCGFAAYGSSICLDSKTFNPEIESDNSLLSNVKSKQWLCVVFFCSPKKSLHWFDYWSRHRYRWWRKFSSIPSKFSMSDVTEPTIGDQQTSLMMEFPWGKEKLETITLYNGTFTRNCYDQINLENGSEWNPNISSSAIVCEAELNLAAIAYLTNSFVEKWWHKELRNLFQLHVKLAPYKVCFFIKSEDSVCLKKLQDVVQHLEKELKKSKITIFPYFHADSANNLQFTRFDEMGIPYTIILNERTLHSGVAGLRSRDTTLEEQIHITELTEKLLKYLQMKSFEADEIF